MENTSAMIFACVLLVLLEDIGFSMARLTLVTLFPVLQARFYLDNRAFANQDITVLVLVMLHARYALWEHIHLLPVLEPVRRANLASTQMLQH